ncbi:class I SAM-dependent methyltransferase [Azospirillum rugosum]|uniref:SAM-dependent methyltransferase n=1 Tax=Azospirillum rugosum TaxID=416170 RepID=A0ABS4SWT3_9PROT|nr:class I SAM-dependent methyltransferase [Azospirillum rugosum]MBP2297013.1 SAM-dependent methyltransferase [Azospirillum rugosum]MDQ0530645.1 SAM-dependent methyltransferase [Azospirillum rugosum]
MKPTPPVDITHNYDEYYRTGLYKHRYPTPNEEVFALVVRSVEEVGNRVLDFGCGNGRYAAPLLDHTDARVIGYDISRVALDDLGARCREYRDNGRLVLIDGDLDNFTREAEPQAPFDLALLMFGVLGHVPTRAGRLETLRRVASLLRPGGRLIASVPNARRRFHAEQAASRERIERGELEPGDITYTRQAEDQEITLYYHLYTPESFVEELEEAGFLVTALEAESVLPESGVVSSLLLRGIDRLLGAVLPVRFAYGFLAVAERDAAVAPERAPHDSGQPVTTPSPVPAEAG